MNLYNLISLVVLLLCSVSKCLCYFVTVDAHAEECFFEKVEMGTKLGKSKATLIQHISRSMYDKPLYFDFQFVRYSPQGNVVLLSEWILYDSFISIRLKRDAAVTINFIQPPCLMFEISEGGFLDIDVKIIGPDNKIIHQAERESSGKYTFAAHMPGTYTYCFSNQMSTMTPKVVMFNVEIGEPHKEVAAGEKGEANKMEEMVNDLKNSLMSVKKEQEMALVRDRIHRAINDSTNSRVGYWSIFESLVLVVMTVGQVYYLKRFFEVRRVV